MTENSHPPGSLDIGGRGGVKSVVGVRKFGRINTKGGLLVHQAGNLVPNVGLGGRLPWGNPRVHDEFLISIRSANRCKYDINWVQGMRTAGRSMSHHHDALLWETSMGPKGQGELFQSNPRWWERTILPSTAMSPVAAPDSAWRSQSSWPSRAQTCQ